MDSSSDENEGETYTSGDIEDPLLPLATSLRKLINALPSISPDCCIYKVPPKLRRVNEKAYIPHMVSIGPFHHGKPELIAMEEHKLRYVQEFLGRAKMSLEDCIDVVKDYEESARNCYAERIMFTSDEFVKIILVDSCFILEAIWRGTANDMEKNSDYLNRPEMILAVQTDMILLENQLPYFVLDDLFSRTFGKLGKETFLELSIRYFIDQVLIKDVDKMIDNVTSYLNSNNKVKHFVDLLRICHLPSTLRSSPTNRAPFRTMPNAVGLQEAGIKLKKGSGNCILDIQYTSGVLELPRISIDDFSECLLRNIIALESCHYPFDSYIIDYVFFMDSLIDTAKDVDLLTGKGIIENWLSDSSEVAALFNNLGNDNTLWGSTYYFHDTCEKLDKYCNVTRHKWMSTFKHDYCSTPWMIASTIGAIILLLLTFVQAICAIISL